MKKFMIKGLAMYNRIIVCFVFMCALFGCAASSDSDATGESSASLGAGPNDFNPWMKKSLPNTRVMNSEGERMLGAMGGSAQSIEREAAHRKNWRDELYPVVFGDKNAPDEIIVVLDFANPESESVWNSVMQASRSLQPARCKIVVYGRNGEPYGTDLMGLAIWIAHQRKGQAMNYLDYALKRWNEVKSAQKSAGTSKTFTNEYDATVTPQDYPIHYAYFSRLNPPVSASQELAVARYCYDAGNVNMYQANQVCQYYGVKKLPAIIVNGTVLGTISVDSILSALR